MAKTMKVERLQHLIKVLSDVSKHHRQFNMNEWASSTENLTDKKVKKNEYCGTSACALGYAALDPEFNEQGLKLQVETNAGYVKKVKNIAEFNEIALSKDGIDSANPMYKGENGIDAGMKFFHISYSASSLLFDPGEYFSYRIKPEYRVSNYGSIKPSQVIARIKKLIDLGDTRFVDELYMEGYGN